MIEAKVCCENQYVLQKMDKIVGTRKEKICSYCGKETEQQESIFITTRGGRITSSDSPQVVENYETSRERILKENKLKRNLMLLSDGVF